jgi:hypothetical protein
MEGMIYLQVAQDLLEQEAQPAEDVLMRLAPPPIPNAEKSFSRSWLPQASQQTDFSWPRRTSASNRFPHALQINS